MPLLIVVALSPTFFSHLSLLFSHKLSFHTINSLIIKIGNFASCYSIRKAPCNYLGFVRASNFKDYVVGVVVVVDVIRR
jgi:hypothetical protein